MAVNWLQNRLIPNELLDPGLFFRSAQNWRHRIRWWLTFNHNALEYSPGSENYKCSLFWVWIILLVMCLFRLWQHLGELQDCRRQRYELSSNGKWANGDPLWYGEAINVSHYIKIGTLRRTCICAFRFWLSFQFLIGQLSYQKSWPTDRHTTS